MRSLTARVKFRVAELIGTAICEPQVRLGRRRHDGTCDSCGEPIDRYGGERLDFPLDDLDPDASSSLEKLRAMFNAEYEQHCLPCAEDGPHDWRFES